MTLIKREDAIEAIKKEIQDFEANYMHGENDEEFGHDIGFVAGLHRAKTFIRSLPSAEAETKCVAQIEVDTGEIVRRIKEEYDITDGWIPCSERLPECEQEVLICTETKLVGKDAYIDSIITPAIYEDGTMLEVESMWNWCDMDFDEWDDTEDCGIIPMGWFENRHFNPDEVYNNPVDRKVVAWMPLPMPYREGGE